MLRSFGRWKRLSWSSCLDNVNFNWTRTGKIGDFTSVFCTRAIKVLAVRSLRVFYDLFQRSFCLFSTARLKEETSDVWNRRYISWSFNKERFNNFEEFSPEPEWLIVKSAVNLERKYIAGYKFYHFSVTSLNGRGSCKWKLKQNSIKNGRARIFLRWSNFSEKGFFIFTNKIIRIS